MRTTKMNRGAFTLLEMLVVIVILGLLAALAIPTFTRAINRSKLETVETTAGSVIRETLALSSFGEGGITRANVEEAVGDLSASADAEGYYAEAGGVSVVFGENEFSSSTSVISVGLSQPEPSEKMGVAIWVPGAGCVVARNNETQVAAWHYLASPEVTPSTCKGSLGLVLDEDSEFLTGPPQASVPNVVNTAGTMAVGWTPVPDTLSAPLTGYRLYSGVGDTEEEARVAASSTATYRTFAKGVTATADGPFADFGFYCYAVSAYGPGGSSNKSAVACAELAPVPVGSTLNGKLFASDAARVDQFGSSVAISGDTLVVGAIKASSGGPASGAAYVFTRSGSSWSQTAKLVPPAPGPVDGAGNGDEFGSSVAISGDTIVVGARNVDVGASTSSGAAYVFTRSGADWAYQTELRAPAPRAYANFGESVSVSGDTVVVGAYRDMNAALPQAGAAYVFTRSGSSWSQGVKLAPSDPAGNALFGTSVSVSGDVIVAGSPALETSRGAAYVFTRSGSSWSQAAKLLEGVREANSNFGSAVAVSGTTVVVGAYGASLNTGAAYVFTPVGASWGNQVKLSGADSVPLDLFGSSVAISGNTIVVGSSKSAAGVDVARAGAAYVFTYDGETWSQRPRVSAFDAAPNAAFAWSVAVDGTTAISGTNSDGEKGYAAGAAYVFQATS